MAAERRPWQQLATLRTSINDSSGHRARQVGGRRGRLWNVISLCTLNGGAGEAYRCDTNAIPASTTLGCFVPLCLAERRRERRRDVTLRALPHIVALTITRRCDEFEAEEDRKNSIDRRATRRKIRKRCTTRTSRLGRATRRREKKGREQQHNWN